MVFEWYVIYIYYLPIYYLMYINIWISEAYTRARLLQKRVQTTTQLLYREYISMHICAIMHHCAIFGWTIFFSSIFDFVSLFLSLFPLCYFSIFVVLEKKLNILYVFVCCSCTFFVFGTLMPVVVVIIGYSLFTTRFVLYGNTREDL